MLERSTLRSLGLLALFCGSSALAGSESAATGKVESIETSVCRLIESSARTQSLPVAFLTRLIRGAKSAASPGMTRATRLACAAEVSAAEAPDLERARSGAAPGG
jgi:hypothetical protein